jgi:hypothetical protein
LNKNNAKELESELKAYFKADLDMILFRLLFKDWRVILEFWEWAF